MGFPKYGILRRLNFRRPGVDNSAIWSASPVLTRKAASISSGVVFLCILLASCGGSSSPKLTTITITSVQSSIAVNATDQFTATGKDQNGNVMTNVTFAWVSSASNVASVGAATGMALGLLPGTTQVT